MKRHSSPMKQDCKTGSSHPLGATLGGGGANPWRRWIDNALDSPNDIVPWEQSPAVQGLTYQAEARSVVALYAPLL